MTDRELMQMVLTTFQDIHNNVSGCTALWRGAFDREISLLERRLAQPEPEPVAWRIHDGKMWCYFNHIVAMLPPPFEPLYPAPPQREWQGLTDEEIMAMRHIRDWTAGWTEIRYAREIEAKLREKNGMGAS